MIALSLDTATSICGVAINDLKNGHLMAATRDDIGRGHAEILMDRIKHCLDQSAHEYRDIKRVIATTGPGSFTGIRVGLSCARAIALTLSVPVVGISNLQACASYAANLEGNENKTIAVLLDARRDQVYFQKFKSGNAIAAPSIIAIQDIGVNQSRLLDDVELLCGNGVEKITDKSAYHIAHLLPGAPIETIATLGLWASPTETRPVPLYLRSPDAKPQNDFAVPRSTPLEAER